MSLRGRSPKQSPCRCWGPLDEILRSIRDCFFGKSALLALTGFLFLLSSCSPAVTEVAPTQVVNIYATQSTQPWLTEAFSCAAKSVATLNLTDPDSAEIVLRLGEPENLSTPAYQIDTEEILIVTHRESSVQNLTLDAAQALFAGQGNPSVQVWVYDPGEDVQQMFDQLVMAGRGVTSFAKVAASPQQMSDLSNAEKDAVGILPKHWKPGDSRIVFHAGTVPVLALVKSEPQGVVREILACLQK